MRFTALIMALGTSIVGPTSARAAADERVMVATLISATGLVRVRDVSASKFVEAKAGRTMAEGAQVVTLEKSRCEILFSEGRMLKLAEGSTVTVARLPKKDSMRSLARLIRGRVKAVVNRAIGEGDFGVYGSTVVSAVKGTEYEFARNEKDEVTVSVDEGRVWVAEIKNENPDDVDRIMIALMLGQIGMDIREGNMLNVIPGSPFPKLPVPMPKNFPSPWAAPAPGGAAPANQKNPGPAMPGFGGFGFP
jgi:ferric-dicitrate binding protein FerR (iron transport regulator)